MLCCMPELRTELPVLANMALFCFVSVSIFAWILLSCAILILLRNF